MDIKTSQDNSEIERSMMGRIISDSETIEHCISRGLTSDDFTDTTMKAIYQSCLTLYESHRRIDVVSLNAMGHDMVMLCGLTMNLIPGSYSSLTDAILTYSARRKAMLALQSALVKLQDARYTTTDEIADIIKNISVDLPCSNRNKPKSLFEIMAEFPDELEREASGDNLKFGWRDLDGLTGGLWPAELTIVAAAPGAGKTGFALNIGRNVAKQGANVLLSSLEMSNLQLAKRFCSIEGNIEGNKLRRPKVNDVELWKAMPGTTTELSKLPIVIDQTKTIQELENKCRRLKERGKLDLLIIDYLQLLKSATRTESRRHEVEYVSRSLKLLSLELDIPIIALSQLSREGQKAVAPSLSDLRESGSLEQDADNVIFLHDPQAKENLSALWVDINIIMAKQRSGQTGILKMRFDKRFMKFYEMEK